MNAITRRKVERIVAVVSERFDVPIDDILGESRRREIVTARHAVIWYCRDVLEMSYPEIGRAFNLDHTTVMHAARRHAKRCRESRVMADRSHMTRWAVEKELLSDPERKA